MNTEANRIGQAYQLAFFENPDEIFRAPGRVNLIGEHTDYNHGFVMPGAIRQALYLASGRGSQTEVVLAAADFGESVQLPLSRFQDDVPLTGIHWQDTLIGVVREFRRRQLSPDSVLRGARLVVGGDLPTGSGLSSSSALAGLFAMWLNQELRSNLDRLDLARIAFDTETRTIGINCGFMDQYAVFHGETNLALLLDCRSLESRSISLDAVSARFELWQSNVPHSLHESEYNDRRAASERVVAAVSGATHLRDVSKEQIEKLRTSGFDPGDLTKAAFVLKENQRVFDFADAIAAVDLNLMGELLLDSHRGLQYEYQVTCEQTDWLADFAEDKTVILGGRQIGGGFGGSVMMMMQHDAPSEELFVEAQESYSQRFGLQLGRVEVELGAGASRLT